MLSRAWHVSRSIIVLFLFAWSSAVFAGEGMWLPNLLKALNEEEMQSMGMRLSAEDIYSVNEGSLKDAIVHFGGFCTSELISAQGLILTNHHCGYGSIQDHSSVDNNLLKNGFWAADLSEELPNPGLTATFIVRIEDVTEVILEGVAEDDTPESRQSKTDININKVLSTLELESYEDAFVRPFYYGNQYMLFVTMTYRDVRLTGTPPESIGKFGADTDNWIWPRHTGDFSLFRIYAGKDNLPADYSPDNVPYKPRHFLPISLGGVKPGDFTMVFGFPGTTRQYLPSYAVAQVQHVIDPLNISIRDRSLAVMDEYMRRDEAIRLAYAPRFAGLANSWKRWIGKVEGLERSNAVKKKQIFEAEFISRLNGNTEWKTAYGRLLPQFKTMYEEIEPYAVARDYYREIFAINIELFRGTSQLLRLLQTYIANGEKAYEERRDWARGYFENYFNNVNLDIDRDIFESLILYQPIWLEERFILPGYDAHSLLVENPDASSVLANEMYTNSLAANREACLSALGLSGEEFAKKMSADPAAELLLQVQVFTDAHVSPAYNTMSTELQKLMREYMQAQLEMFPEHRFWPDANSTMRITYGKVQGYQPRDAVDYASQTYLEGVIEKYVPGDYEFDVHPKLLDLYLSKDYGRYGEEGKMPVCFIGTNHTTGGNSGSPAIDADGNLIGLNFDRVWDGTMSDLNFDPEICRNIMVDIRYVLFIIDKFAGADHLIEEMSLILPKD